MQGYFFVAATVVYAALKWQYLLRDFLPHLGSELERPLSPGDVAAPIVSAVLAFSSAGIVLLRDDGFFLPASDGTKMAYVVLAGAAFSMWVPDSTLHALAVNALTLFLAAYNLGERPRGWWWTVLALQGCFYLYNMKRRLYNNKE